MLVLAILTMLVLLKPLLTLRALGDMYAMVIDPDRFLD